MGQFFSLDEKIEIKEAKNLAPVVRKVDNIPPDKSLSSRQPRYSLDSDLQFDLQLSFPLDLLRFNTLIFPMLQTETVKCVIPSSDDKLQGKRELV